jgi:hypothetical protein
MLHLRSQAEMLHCSTRIQGLPGRSSALFPSGPVKQDFHTLRQSNVQVMGSKTQMQRRLQRSLNLI